MDSEIIYDIDWKEIGKNIRIRREILGMSQAALAYKTGLNVNTINKLETNQRCRPSYSTIVRIANALKISMDDLNRGCLIDVDYDIKDKQVLRYDIYVISLYDVNGKFVISTEIIDDNDDRKYKRLNEYLIRIMDCKRKD